MAKTLKLVSPDGSQTREVEEGSPAEVKARWDGYLPEQQAKLPAPKVEAPSAPKTVGSNA